MGVLSDLLARVAGVPTPGELHRRAAAEMAEVSLLDAEWERLERHVAGIAPRVAEPFRIGWARAWAGWKRALALPAGERAAQLEAWRQLLGIWDALLRSPQAVSSSHAYDADLLDERGRVPGERVDVGQTVEKLAGGIPWWGVSAITLAFAAGATYAGLAVLRAIEEKDLERARRIVSAHGAAGGAGSVGAAAVQGMYVQHVEHVEPEDDGRMPLYPEPKRGGARREPSPSHGARATVPQMM